VIQISAGNIIEVIMKILRATSIIIFIIAMQTNCNYLMQLSQLHQ